jgi:hypothetical protein
LTKKLTVYCFCLLVVVREYFCSFYMIHFSVFFCLSLLTAAPLVWRVTRSHSRRLNAFWMRPRYRRELSAGCQILKQRWKEKAMVSNGWVQEGAPTYPAILCAREKSAAAGYPLTMMGDPTHYPPLLGDGDGAGAGAVHAARSRLPLEIWHTILGFLSPQDRQALSEASLDFWWLVRCYNDQHQQPVAQLTCWVLPPTLLTPCRQHC